ncbi:MAG: rfbG [Ignavibacteria bacterium]|nr:rfbG [Ignavibacteria bacterium]
MHINTLFKVIYQGKKVLITGHTGFKGSWLALWLTKLGAEVIGYSLPPPTEPNHYNLLNLDINSTIADIRDLNKLIEVFQTTQPDIVFHLAAQPIVRLSYQEPIETLSANIIGTANVLEACRKTQSVKAAVMITSDKCYENKEWIWGYKETDQMGGYDPYSASKGCAELVISSYRNSFFNLKDYGKSHNSLIASTRAGNVIGGGDWAPDRLMPDIARATSESKPVIIRNPKSTRPWQHVLDPLFGYLLLGSKLLEGKPEFADAWNFGPGNEGMLSVIEVSELFKKSWSDVEFVINHDANAPHEASMLKLDISKANYRLNWKPVWETARGISATAEWYKEYYQNGKIITEKQLGQFCEDIERLGF